MKQAYRIATFAVFAWLISAALTGILAVLHDWRHNAFSDDNLLAGLFLYLLGLFWWGLCLFGLCLLGERLLGKLGE